MKRGEWAWGWTHIKMYCEHANTHFVVKMLERIEEGAEDRRKVNSQPTEEAEVGEGEEGGRKGGEVLTA